ncbi:MAG: C-terminal target protein, partial [Verrucomicrobiales bacterium]|nr:C-terminal target protein [Verrucomicrobiales bacterium]
LNANGNVDVTFNPGGGPNNLVRAAVAQADGKIVIGGDFTFVNGTPRGRLARFNSDGSLDGTFTPSADAPVYALALQADGKIVAGGAFANINGSQQNGIARLTSSGAVDGTFSPGSGANGLVRSVAVQTNGMVLLGGDFITVNGAATPHLARLTSSGAVDNSFNAGFGPDGSVYGIAAHSAGKIAIAGDFLSVNGFPRSRFARLRANGSIDFTFNMTSGANSNVNAVVVQPNSAIVIGGEFTEVNGLSRNRLARIHGDDRFVPTTVEFGSLVFNAYEDSGAALINVVRSGNTNTSFTVQFATADGTALAGFDYIATNGTLSFGVGETVKSFTVPLINDALFELDETVNLLLTNAPVIVDIGLPGILVIKDDEKSVQFSATDYSVVEHGSNGIVTVVRTGQLTGEVSVVCFTTDGSATAPADYTATSNLLVFPANVATQTMVIPIIDDFRKESNETIVVTLVNPTGGTTIGNFFRATLTIIDDDFGPGTPDATFDPGMGANSLVRTLAVQGDGKVIIGGAFTNVGGLDRRFVARLGTNGAVDIGFNPGVGPNALVSAVATNSNGRVLIAGNFGLVGSSSRNRFAQLQGDGSLETSFSGSNGINAAVFAILPQSNNRGFVAGAFSLPFNRVGRLRSDGTPDSTFFAGTGPNGTVYSAVAQTNGQIIIGGDFTAVNSISRYRVARMDADGTLDLSFQPPVIVTGAVFSVAVQLDGKVVIGGDFTLVNGTNRSRVARLNQDGSLDTSFNPGSGANAIVYAVASQPDGKVLLGGDFTSINGTNRNRFARLNQNGTLDTTFEPGTGANNTVFALAPMSDGKVVIAGNFTLVNGLPRAGVARLSGDDPIDVTIQGNSIYLNGQFTIYFSGQTGQGYGIEASTDFVNWTSLGSVTAAGPITSFTDVNAGAFGRRFYRVRRLAP